MLIPLPLLALAPLLATQDMPPPDWTIGAGQTVEFDAEGGLLEVQSLTIEAGASLRFLGDCPVNLRVRGTMRVDGVLDVSGSGFNTGFGVTTINTTNLQEPGRVGGPGGGTGGTGNRINFASSAIGGDGGCGFGGGHGGESAYGPLVGSQRHAGGGGGGNFGPALPLVNPDPFHASNNGRVARPGLNGSPTALGAISMLMPPMGGAAGISPFLDGNPNNDFWGRRFDPVTSTILVGELSGPRGGGGGAAGGNSIAGSVYPNPNWGPTGDEKGAGGAGGGGLLLVRAQLLRVGPGGRILANGGRGGTGENSAGLDVIGGSSGGGSGGMIVVHARRVDLSAASNHCFSALGGDGGRGADNLAPGAGAGGDGGPGLIQLHLANGLQDVILPGGSTLANLSVPEAHVLLPQPGY